MQVRFLSTLRNRWDHVFPTTHHSVIRPSLATTILFLGGHAFYYLLIIGANRLLDSHGFGRFYTAWVAINVLVAPGSIVALFLTGYLAEYFRTSGVGAVLMTLRALFDRGIGWVIGAVCVSEVLLYVFGVIVGVDSLFLLHLVPLAAASIVAIEIVRGLFSSLLRFAWSGLTWFVSCAARFVLGIVGLVLVAAPWGAIVGLTVANMLILLALVLLVGRMAGSSVDSPYVATAPALASLRDVLPFSSAFAGFVLLSNADIFVAYLMLPAGEVGHYAAAAILPKAIVTATLPLAQTALSVVVNTREERERYRRIVTKTVALAFVLGTGGLAALWVGADLVCGTRLGLMSCEPQLMLLLGMAAIPLAILRTMISADLGLRRFGKAHLPAAVFVIFMAVELTTSPSAADLAISFVASAWAALILLAVIEVFRRRAADV